MNVTVSANFRFSVVAIQYAPDGELNITLDSDASNEGTHYRYSAQLGSGQAEVQHSVSCLDDITLYPSPFLVVTGHGYTKHYYAGAERVAARLGAGGLNHDSVCVGNNMDAEQTADSLFLEATELANKMEYRRPTTSGIVRIDGSAIGGLGDFNPDDVPVSMQAEVTINPNRIHETIGTLSPTGQPAHNSEPEVYFYHSDHLGSASWITNSNGKPIQHLQYLPFGEPFVDRRSGNYGERFRFTGKEKDEETGYGYFGARYMDHELMAMWLSVDPMADKYPSISPYAYCAWNPVKLVDPDGREVYITGDEKSKEEALRQIQQKSKNMAFSIDKNGKLTFSGKAKSKAEKYMARIIESREVQVNLQVQDHSNYNGETIDIGGFGGNNLSDDKKTVSTNQVINVARSAEQDKICKNPGNIIWHEISESYEGGAISLRTGKSAPAAIRGNDRTIFNEAHYKAGKYFPGTITSYKDPLPAELQGMGIEPKTKYKYTRL